MILWHSFDVLGLNTGDSIGAVTKSLVLYRAAVKNSPVKDSTFLEGWW